MTRTAETIGNELMAVRESLDAQGIERDPIIRILQKQTFTAAQDDQIMAYEALVQEWRAAALDEHSAIYGDQVR